MKIEMWLLLFPLLFAPALSACNPDADRIEDTRPDIPPDDEPGAGDDEPAPTALRMTIGGKVFALTLADNATARAFAALLPLTVEMDDLNGNEKFFHTGENLPTDASRPGTIRAGDVMLYGRNCVVLFYETFTSSYSYTRLGRVDDATGLAAAVGSGSVTVAFAR